MRHLPGTDPGWRPAAALRARLPPRVPAAVAPGAPVLPCLSNPVSAESVPTPERGRADAARGEAAAARRPSGGLARERKAAREAAAGAAREPRAARDEAARREAARARGSATRRRAARRGEARRGGAPERPGETRRRAASARGAAHSRLTSASSVRCRGGNQWFTGKITAVRRLQ